MDGEEGLLAKQEIIEVTARYARAIDRMDEEMLRSVFHPDSQHNHFYAGPSSDPQRPADGDDPGDFVRFAFQVLSAHTHTHHQHLTFVNNPESMLTGSVRDDIRVEGTIEPSIAEQMACRLEVRYESSHGHRHWDVAVCDR